MQISKIWNRHLAKLVNDDLKQYYNFSIISYLMGITNFVMAIINIITKNIVLAYTTIIFGITCTVFAILMTKRKVQSITFMYIISICMLVFLNFFTITGMAEGFSSLWMLLYPICTLFIFEKKDGTILSAVQLVVLIFFFYTPWGQSLLQYQYTTPMLNRFPILYLFIYAIALYIESCREYTYNAMVLAKEQYQQMYNRDALTGIYNRYGFNGFIDESFNKLQATEPIALLIIDIDHFKYINDWYGHSTGDIILRCVSETISNTIAEKGIVCRWGGEEFAILLTDGKYCSEYEAITENIRKTVQEKEFHAYDNSIKVTVSIGGALSDKANTHEAELLMNTADHCLYEAKDKGRNQTVCKPVIPKELPL